MEGLAHSHILELIRGFSQTEHVAIEVMGQEVLPVPAQIKRVQQMTHLVPRQVLKGNSPANLFPANHNHANAYFLISEWNLTSDGDGDCDGPAGTGTCLGVGDGVIGVGSGWGLVASM